jgi:hypothetical protein
MPRHEQRRVDEAALQQESKPNAVKSLKWWPLRLREQSLPQRRQEGLDSAPPSAGHLVRRQFVMIFVSYRNS